ncbi:MAG: jacalin-like lectin [Kangiellaceae bacterium]|jgi:hypothetical protein|nr:jacalin-like lectin [Kangiellaceae bacterium]
MMNGYPKITKLAVWSSQMIHGIRVWYSLNGNPAADAKNFKKKEIKKGCTKQVFPLDTDEFIVSLSGRSGAVLDHLTIVTSKGKRLDVGGSGGNPFDLQIPQGFTIGAFKGGYGGHIHNLGGILVPIVMP